MPRGRKPFHQVNEFGERVKVCPRCRETLTMEFYNMYSGKRSKQPQSLCKECNKKECRERDLVRKYGVSLTLYREMLAAQGGACKICGGVNADGRPLFVDHCHKTGNVRYLLCHCCNSGLGHFKDDPELLAKAIEYLTTV